MKIRISKTARCALIGLLVSLSACSTSVRIEQAEFTEIAFDPTLPLRSDAETQTYRLTVRVGGQFLEKILKHELSNHLYVVRCTDGSFIKSPTVYFDGVDTNDFDNLRHRTYIASSDATLTGDFSSRDLSGENVCVEFVGGNYLLRRLRSNRIPAKLVESR